MCKQGIGVVILNKEQLQLTNKYGKFAFISLNQFFQISNLLIDPGIKFKQAFDHKIPRSRYMYFGFQI